MKVIEFYKNIHRDKDFVIFGSGPSLLKWDDKFIDAIKIGCNGVFSHKTNLDYHFVQDSGKMNNNETCYLKNQDLYNSYQPNIAKFYGGVFLGGRLTPQSMTEEFCDKANAIRYIMSLDKNDYYQLDTLPICEWGNVIFSCIQFAIFTGAKRIIIAGCDVSNNIRLGESEEHNCYKQDNLIEIWKNFINIYNNFCSSESRSISIECFQPLGLKGILKEFKT